MRVGDVTWASTVACVAFASATAIASMPCRLPQVRLAPGTNSTAAELPLVVAVDEPASSLPKPLRELIRVEAEDGTEVKPEISVSDEKWGVRAQILGLDPGWYTVRLDLPPVRRESSDRSFWVTDASFFGEVLVGRSDPALALVDFCEPLDSFYLRWAEMVRFDGDVATAVELFSDAGTALPCSNVTYGYDGGFDSRLVLRCPYEPIRAMRLARPPHGMDGSVAGFPPPGQIWEMTGWAEDRGNVAKRCWYWQPSVHRRTHESLTTGGLAPSYWKCRREPEGCGCSAGPLSLGTLGLGLLLWLRRAR